VHIDVDGLIVQAEEARRRAYVPYSRYAVGAAVLTTSGAVYTGCNIENASYGLTVCAERVAVWTAVAAGHRAIVAIAIVTTNQASPCGACRQVLAEFGVQTASGYRGQAGLKGVLVILANPQGERRLMSLADLLPEAFTAQHIERA
jgi:cytidine deaminase